MPPTDQVFPSLIGRDEERARLAGLLRAASIRRGGALIVSGDPGIGKSALLDEAAIAAASERMRVLRTAGVQSETRMPFAGLHQLLRPILASAELLPAPQHEAIQTVFGTREGNSPELFLIALSVFQMLVEASEEEPLLVLVEDAHWLDAATAEILTFSARRIGSDPIAMLVAQRAADEGPFISAGLPRMRLEGLDRAAASALLSREAPALSQGWRERLLFEAQGNPLALIELPLTLTAAPSDDIGRSTLTARLESAFLARAETLPPDARLLLRVAALNDGMDLAETLAAGTVIAGRSLSMEALSPAVTGALVTSDGRRLSFRHPLIRSAVDQSTPLAERLAVHAALAEVLRAQPARQLWHQAAAAVGADAELADQLESAADDARRRGDVAAGAATLERAAQLSDDDGLRARRLLRAAELSVELGRREAVNRCLRDSSLLPLSPVELGRRLWIEEMLDPGINGDAQRVSALVHAAEVAIRDGSEDLAINLLSAATFNGYWADCSEKFHDQITAVVRRLSDRVNAAQVLSITAHNAPHDEWAAIGVHITELRGEVNLSAHAMQLLADAAFALGMHRVAADYLDACVDRLRREGRLVALAQALVERAWCRIHIGRWDGAIADAQDACRMADETAQPIWLAGGQVAEAMVAALRSDAETALRLVQTAEEVVLPAESRAVEAVVVLVRGVVALGEGRFQEAFEHLARMLSPRDIAHHRLNNYWALGYLAEAAARIGATSVAASLIEAAAARAAVSSPLFQHGVAHAHALLTTDDAEASYAQALAVSGAVGPFDRARTLLAYGMWLRRRRQPVQARAPLRIALEIFESLRAPRWVEIARGELRGAGEAAREPLPDLVIDLTPQELQIARMAATGLSNREIGQALYLSHRTVSSHLYRAFPKLGVTQRAQLAGALPPEA
jgi:DNA-binding CsgD family transcriptional regulator